MEHFKTAEEVCQEIKQKKIDDYKNSIKYIIDKVISSNGKYQFDPNNRFAIVAHLLQEYPNLQKELESLGYKFTIKKYWFASNDIIISACCDSK